MTSEQFREAADCVRDLQFIQAAALVATKTQGNKDSKAYMNRLAVLQQVLEEEALK